MSAGRLGTWLSHDDSRGRYAPGTEFHIGRRIDSSTSTTPTAASGFAFPVNVRGMGTFPVRAFARID